MRPLPQGRRRSGALPAALPRGTAGWRRAAVCDCPVPLWRHAVEGCARVPRVRECEEGAMAATQDGAGGRKVSYGTLASVAGNTG